MSYPPSQSLIREIGVAVRTQRESLHVTLDELAEVSGYSRNTVGALERGSTESVRLSLLDDVCRALGLDMVCMLANINEGAAVAVESHAGVHPYPRYPREDGGPAPHPGHSPTPSSPSINTSKEQQPTREGV